MEIIISKVKAGDLLTKKTDKCDGFIVQAAPADGLLIRQGDDDKVYVRNLDLGKALALKGDDASITVDPWRDDGATPTQ